MSKISAVVLTHNSASVLKPLYQVLKRFDEVIAIDDNSTDDTKILCKKLGIRYFNRELNSDFSSQRNFALQNALNDWVFFIDSDEQIDNNFVDEVKKLVSNSSYSAFRIKRKVVFLGHMMHSTEMNNDKIIRLAKKSAGKWHRSVHEIWKVDGRMGELKSSIIHNTANNLKSFIDKINSYHEGHARENQKVGKSIYFCKIFLLSLGKFIKNYFLLKGFKDGSYGFVVSILMSFHTFLSWSDYWLAKEKSA